MYLVLDLPPSSLISQARQRPRQEHKVVKVASGPASAAFSSASIANLANFTSILTKLPPALQSYLDTTVSHLSYAVTGSTDFFQSTVGLPPEALYGTVAAAALLLGAIPAVYARSNQASKAEQGVPKSKSQKKNQNRNRNKKTNRAKSQERTRPISKKKKMDRYGWSSRQPRETISPYASTLGGGIPSVTDQDYEYITSEDLGNQDLDLEIPDDDILLIKNGRTTSPEHFPAYAIGDGKLEVGDIRDRIQLLYKLSDKRTARAKLLYKGRQLSDDKEPVARYGVKNNSEIMVVIPEGSLDDDSESSEEVVVVDPRDGEAKRKTKRRSKKDRSRSPTEKDSGVGSSAGPSAGLDVPGRDGRQAGASRNQSPASGVSGVSASSAVPNGALETLDKIASDFNAELLPLCIEFTSNPPDDEKKRKDEHRKISETIMQKVLLKLDGVETMGDDQARARRKELVRQVQEVLKQLDNKAGI